MIQETKSQKSAESASIEENVVKAVSQLEYPDARLRDLVGKWVIFNRSLVEAPECTIGQMNLQYPLLLGFLYVDRGNGFRLSIQRELAPATPDTKRRYESRGLQQFKWDLNYDEIKRLPLRELAEWEVLTLQLPPLPVRLVMAGHFNTAVSHCRRIRALDNLVITQGAR